MAQYGGLEEDFVDEVKDTLICHICTKPLRDPHLTVCCGHNFCESCLEQWSTKHREQCCPFCRSTGEEFQHVLDKKAKREVNALKVRCSNREKGCKWVGELGALKRHIDVKDGCGYMEVACPNACKRERKVMRKDLQHHLKAECEKRPHQCEHCGEKGTFVQITSEHYQGCPYFPLDCPNKCGIVQIKRMRVNHHRKQCPLEAVGCPFKEVGCRAVGLLRKDEAEHMEKNVVNHQLLMLKSNQEKSKRAKDEWDQKVAVISKNIESLLVTCTDEQRLPLQSICSVIADSYCLKLGGPSLSLYISNFSKYQESSAVWYSPPFYLGDIAGLKLRLAVYPNGVQEGAGTHVSLIIECLESDARVPKDIECGSYIKVVTGSNVYKNYVCETHDICECKNSRETWLAAAVRRGFCRVYQFVTQESVQTLCYNNTLELQTSWRKNRYSACDCTCHEWVDIDD